MEINFLENEDGDVDVLAEVSATGTKLTDLTFLVGDGNQLIAKISFDASLTK